MRRERLTDYQNQTLATMEQQGALIERSLREGEKLQFNTSKGPRGNFAVNIQLMDV